jgi:hypothetical protein
MYGSAKWAYVHGISPPDGNWLALCTGRIGCSAYQIDSNPNDSAVRAMKAGSSV